MTKNLQLLTGVLSLIMFFSCSQMSKVSEEARGLKIQGVKEERPFFFPSWIKNLDIPHSTGNLPIGLHSPAIEKGILYMGHNIGVMKAFDLENGRGVWAEKEDHPYHAPPVVHKQMIIYGNIEGRLFARDRFSGTLLYNVDLGAAIESQPTLYKGRLLVHTRNHKVVCLDALTGKVLWAYKRSVPFLTTLQRVSRPVANDNKIYVGFADGHMAAFTLEEGVMLWESRVVDGRKFIDVDTSPLFFGGKILVGSPSGLLSVLSPVGGLIERRLPYSVSRAPVVLGDSLILGTVEGELVLLDSNLNKTSQIKLGEDSISSITIWKDRIVASTTGGELVAVTKDLKNEVERFRFGHSSSALFGELVVGDEKLAAYSSRNRLYVFK